MRDKQSEELTATRLGEGESARLKLSIKKEGRIGEGFNATVGRVAVSRGENKAPLRMAHKKFDNYSEESMQQALEVHQKLIRLPHGREYTVPTLRATEKGLLMTDLTEGGKNFVLSSNDPHAVVMDRIYYTRENYPELIENFTKTEIFDDAWIESFMEKIDSIAHETAAGHVALSGDSVFFVCNPEGEVVIRITELDNVHIDDDASEESLYFHNFNALQDIEPFIRVLWGKMQE